MNHYATLPSTATVTARRRAHALRLVDGAAAPARLERWVAGLGFSVDAQRVARAVPASLVIAVFAAVLFGGAVPAGIVVSGLAAVTAWLSKGSARRRALAIDRDLPLVLEAVARHLRSGGSLSQAIVAAGPNARGTLGETWTRLGSDLGVVGVVEALDRWADGRAGATTVRPSERLAATALALAAETGGSPARAVDGVASTLRTRQALGEEIRALSSQARSSAVVIALAPLAFGGLAGVTDSRTSTFFGSSVGLTMLAAGLSLDLVGAWWMARLCRLPTT